MHQSVGECRRHLEHFDHIVGYPPREPWLDRSAHSLCFESGRFLDDMLDADKIEPGELCLRIDVNQHVEITVRVRVTTGTRTEMASRVTPSERNAGAVSRSLAMISSRVMRRLHPHRTEDKHKAKYGVFVCFDTRSAQSFGTGSVRGGYSAAALVWPSRRLSASSKPSAASAITVPGGKIASAPAALRAS
jgi:hypothetical protein